jgi:hypothetical protein
MALSATTKFSRFCHFPLSHSINHQLPKAATRKATAAHRDPLGRWCSSTLTGKDARVFQIYSIYQCVNVRMKNAGPKTYLAQQWYMLQTAGQDDPNPRKQLIQDLKKELMERKRRGIQHILLGDFNEVLGHNPALMASICAELGLI